jgi:hypothetical protein
VKISKEEALKRFPKSNKQMGYICPFHMRNPDQEAIMNTCPKCVYVQDLCGCGWEEECNNCQKKEGLNDG